MNEEIESAYRRELLRMRPLLQEAEEAHSRFTAGWKEGSRTLGWESYKKTEEYDRLLDRHYATQKRHEEEIEPALDALRTGDLKAIETALAYLAVKARPFRSGYTSTHVVRALRRVTLEETHGSILRGIILDRLCWPWASVVALWRWIPTLKTPDFEASLRALADHEIPWIRTRVQRVTRRFLEAKPLPPSNGA